MKKQIKMKALTTYKLWLLGCLIICLSTSQSFAQKYVKKKSIDKSYSLADGKPLEIHNKYGKVHINTSSSSENVDVKIEMIAKSNNETKAETLLAGLNVNVDEGSAINPLSPIVFKTNVSINSKGNNQFEVNYLVSLPKSANLTVTNKYGDIYLDEHTGTLYLNVKYGNLSAEKLSGEHSKLIEISFGNADIDYLEQGKIEIKYSNLDMDGSASLDLVSAYSNTSIEDVETLSLNCKYGDAELGTVGKITGSSSYSGFELDELKQSMDLDIAYNSDFEVEKVADDFTEINLDCKFSECDLGFSNTACFEVDMNMKYADWNKGEIALDLTKETGSSNHKMYQGVCGQGTPKAKVKVVSSYSDMNFDVN